ncbi:MAG: conjugative transposon protein TraM, partial [Bacteroidota bacterium]|nr:conjugative transposon protein TraM [Bacteroidota bacterium]
MQEKHSAKFLRQRKMMMALPFLVIPFVTMAFWALGGGKGPESVERKNNSGLNLNLPDANLKNDRYEDKLSFYKEADDDSLKRQQVLRNDPYYNDSISHLLNATSPETGNVTETKPLYGGLNYSPYNQNIDANEQRIYEKINDLKKQINLPDTPSPSNSNFAKPNQSGQDEEQFSMQVDRLQSMMQQVTDKPETDPEMDELNNTLDKILDVQHPQRIKDKIKEKSLKQKKVVFPVSIHS